MCSNESEGFSWSLVLIWALCGCVEHVCVMKSTQQGFVHYSFTLVCVCLYQSSSDKPTLEQSNTHYFHSWDIYSWYAEIRVGLNCRGLGWLIVSGSQMSCVHPHSESVKRADLCKTHEVRNTHALNSYYTYDHIIIKSMHCISHSILYYIILYYIILD